MIVIRRLLMCCTVASAIASGASPVRVLRTVETREPADHALTLLHGETIDLRVRMLNYASPIDLTGWTITLHGQTNGQTLAESYQLAGAAGLSDDPAAAAQGWASADVSVSTWWPADAASGRWTMLATSPDTSNRVLRAGGPLSVSGTAAADLAAPLPTSIVDTIYADILSTSNALAIAIQAGGGGATLPPDATNGWEVGSHTGLATWPGATNAAAAVTRSWADTGTVARAMFADASTRADSADWTPEATHAGVAETAYDLLPDGPAGSALAAATNHSVAPDAHPAIRQSIVAATNTLIQTYLLGTNAWMTISNATLSIWRTVSNSPAALWSSAESTGGSAIDSSFTNAVWAALAGVQSSIDTKASKAWGQYAPDGSANPDPAYMTYLNSPATMHASGFQWSTYGTYSVMSQSGSVSFESGGDGQARWGLDIYTNYVGFVKGGSVIIGAQANSITVADSLATIIYPYTDGDFPVLWYSPSLSVPFTVQEGIVWVDNDDDTATVTAPATAAAGFWYATTSTQIDVIFETRPPVHMRGGVFGSTNDVPVVYDATITVSSGGKSYRIPAQEIP